jgi:prepilin-type processing-associated H-X9-DG protein
MFELADSRALQQNNSGNAGGVPVSVTGWEANLDPTQDGQWPSNRHQKYADIMFCDGHSEHQLRNAIIDPSPGNKWRNSWNNDNQPHEEVTWTVNLAEENDVDK